MKNPSRLLYVGYIECQVHNHKLNSRVMLHLNGLMDYVESCEVPCSMLKCYSIPVSPEPRSLCLRVWLVRLSERASEALGIHVFYELFLVGIPWTADNGCDSG